jgi:crossover junction endodeoxyribonuclease RuvC
MDNDKLIAYGSIIPDRKMNHCEKLMYIYNRINSLFEDHNITEVSIEDQHLRKNVDTLKLLSRIGGVAMLCAQQHGVPTTLYPATTIKHIFANDGHADKSMMISRAVELYNLQRSQIDDNIADSIGVAYTHIKLQGEIPILNKTAKRGKKKK